jgi:hypothetical protein
MKHASEISQNREHAAHGEMLKSRPPRNAESRLVAGKRVGAYAPGGAISPDERQRLIATAAYYHAERRGFAPGCELEDWCAAEAEIEQRLKHG